MRIAAKFLSALAREGMINESALSDQELGVVYGPLREQVTDSVHRQETLLANIQVCCDVFFSTQSFYFGVWRCNHVELHVECYETFVILQRANMEFTQAKAGNQSASSRETKLKDMATAYDSFVELKSNIDEGTKVWLEF